MQLALGTSSEGGGERQKIAGVLLMAFFVTQNNMLNYFLHGSLQSLVAGERCDAAVI